MKIFDSLRERAWWLVPGSMALFLAGVMLAMHAGVDDSSPWKGARRGQTGQRPPEESLGDSNAAGESDEPVRDPRSGVSPVRTAPASEVSAAMRERSVGGLVEALRHAAVSGDQAGVATLQTALVAHGPVAAEALRSRLDTVRDVREREALGAALRKTE